MDTKAQIMDTGKKQEAKELYYQTDLTKTEIANALGISRRCLHYWIKADNWDKIKGSAQNLPSILAEKCYHIIGQLTDNYLDEYRHKPVTLSEAETIYKLMLTIRKLKNHSTVNESMEMFKNFHERLYKHDEGLAKSLAPYVERYFYTRHLDTERTSQSKDYNAQGRLIHKVSEIDPDEEWGPNEKTLDNQDFVAWDKEKENTGAIAEPDMFPPATTPS